ncbi:MAG: hypothetical protein IPJ66_18360 [Bacteroidetes bacterium]|nr:hypothetical protein [Bacteroidota bacterium]MBL0064257.1 hypothetical protein [Bacteroidota bacterium]MBL0139361.1 hypothetical protein [Bacteroidota bacterium]
MHISIYGVGRSGTKAIQLYLSYLLAQKHNSVWINYEPYFWLDRKTNTLNYEGFYHHSTSPHIVSDPKKLSSGHIRFLKKLTKPDKPIVTKFIRGNGRINAINQILQPDYNFIIVRDLYQVLISVLKTNWDFLSVGFEYRMSWEKFISEVKKSGIVEQYDWCIDRIYDRLDQNAFYWYVMNLAALQCTFKPTYFLDYKSIQEIEGIANDIIQPKEKESIKNPILSGDYIHGDFPLISPPSKHSKSDLLNSVLYKTQIIDKYGYFIPNRRIGNASSINQEYQLIESASPPQTKVTIEKKDLYEFFNEDIRTKLTAKRSGI